MEEEESPAGDLARAIEGLAEAYEKVEMEKMKQAAKMEEDESCEGFRVGVDQVLQENAERDQQIEQWMMVINNILLVYDDHTLSKIAIFEDLDEKLLKCWRSTTICLCMMIIHYQIML